MNDTKQATEDVAILEQLNNDYVHSDQFNDVERFSELLAEDFIVQLPGVTRNRAEFLEYIAKPRPFKDLAVHDVNIRILSDVALIHGRALTPCSRMEWSRKLCTPMRIRSVRARGSVSQPVRSLRAPDREAAGCEEPGLGEGPRLRARRDTATAEFGRPPSL